MELELADLAGSLDRKYGGRAASPTSDGSAEAGGDELEYDFCDRAVPDSRGPGTRVSLRGNGRLFVAAAAPDFVIPEPRVPPHEEPVLDRLEDTCLGDFWSSRFDGDKDHAASITFANQLCQVSFGDVILGRARHLRVAMCLHAVAQVDPSLRATPFAAAAFLNAVKNRPDRLEAWRRDMGDD